MSWYGKIDPHSPHKICIDLTPIVRNFLYDSSHMCLISLFKNLALFVSIYRIINYFGISFFCGIKQ